MSTGNAEQQVLASSGVKTCPTCSAGFTIEHLLQDAFVEPIGMLVEEGATKGGAYFFNHTCAGCGTTFAVPTDTFSGMITEPIPEALLLGSAACGGHCTRLQDLASCYEPCSSAPFRRFLVDTLVRKRP